MIKKEKGLTLIEMISIIVILGLAIPVLLNMWADVAWRSSRSEAIAEATFYAQELMEEIRSKDFEDPNQTPGFGAESGESGRSNYDDVDDFNGYSDAPATGYTRSVAVDYVSLSGTTWAHSVSSTDFKRIVVSVSRTDNFASDVSLITIAAAY